jgi:hypothetical protein
LSGRYIAVLLWAAYNDTAESQLVSRAVVSVPWWHVVVARHCFVTNGCVFEALRVSDADVRLLKEFNTLLGQLIGLGTHLLESVLRFGGSCLAPWTNLVVGRADVVCDERRQRRVNNLGFVEFVLGVILSRCRLVDSCVWRADHRAVPLYFGFISHV